MPRLRYIEESEKTSHTRELIESAKRTGAPDPRVVSLMTRSKLGIAWVEYWNKLLYQGVLPHKLKEMCRIKISVAHQCGYCSTVRSNVAKAEGLTESMINDLFDYTGSQQFSAREKAALRYADLFKQGEHAIDKDEVYAELAKHFSDEEIIELGLFCAEVDGVGKFVKSLNVLSWEEACELNPKLGTDARRGSPRNNRGLARDFALCRRRLPAFGGGIVARLGLDPDLCDRFLCAGLLAARLFHLLPERRAGFQIIHEKFRSRERRLAMARRRDHQHDVLARRDAAVAVDDSDAKERPARSRRLDMPADLGLGHSWIMFEFKRSDRFAIFVCPADPGKRDNGADIGAPARQRRDFAGSVERFALQTDDGGHFGRFEHAR